MIMNQQNPSRMPGAGLHATLTRFKSFLYNLLNGFIIELKSIKVNKKHTFLIFFQIDSRHFLQVKLTKMKGRQTSKEETKRSK